MAEHGWPFSLLQNLKTGARCGLLVNISMKPRLTPRRKSLDQVSDHKLDND
jgi:hypothetical protein